ncbi:MAG: M23 family metallopeptidase [Rectinemataceae bacterium]
MIRLRTRQSFQLAMLIGLPIFILGSVFLIKPEASSLAKGKIEDSVASPASMSGKELSEALSWREIDALEPAEARAFGAALVTRALSENRKPEHYASSTFPTASETLAMLARDRDVDDYLENAAGKGPAGDYYQTVVDLVPSMKPLRAIYEKLFQGVYEAVRENDRLKVPAKVYADAELYKGGITLPGLSSKPRERDYDYSHTFALDIFLKEVDLLPFSTLQKGPVLFSVADAIVVATESSWKGGEELATYRSGGITPKAGNGVILYSPSKHKYYLYFHLYDVLVSPGEAIPKGYPLGHGGNTGTNARKKGHGEHLHLEIYDAVDARFLRNYEIADIVF